MRLNAQSKTKHTTTYNGTHRKGFKMAGLRYRNYDEFRNEMLKTRSGPLISPIEDMADEIYHQDFRDEFDSLWDNAEMDDE